MQFNELVKKAISHKSAIDASTRDIKENEILIGKREKELENVKGIFQTTKFSYSYLDVLVKEESGKFIKRLNEVLDYGVKTIFDDCEYSIEIRVSDNNKAVIHLVYDDEEGNKLSPDIQVCGGGIRTVVGILMQIFFIFHYRLETIVFVDEGFSQVSSQYLPNLFALINELCEKNGLKVLLVTHDPRLLKFAKTQYEISDGKAIKLAVVQDSSVGGDLGECNPDTIN